MTVSDLPTNRRGRSADYSMLLEMKRRQRTVQGKVANPTSTKRPFAPETLHSKGFTNGVVDLYFTKGLKKNYSKF
jgi:hypothetical protein